MDKRPYTDIVQGLEPESKWERLDIRLRHTLAVPNRLKQTLASNRSLPRFRGFARCVGGGLKPSFKGAPTAQERAAEEDQAESTCEPTAPGVACARGPGLDGQEAMSK